MTNPLDTAIKLIGTKSKKEAISYGVDLHPTGVLSLDLSLGGGIPVGRPVELFGPESSGKTTLAIHMAAEIQKNGSLVSYVDAEHTLDLAYATTIGIRPTELFVVKPSSSEQALEAAIGMCRLMFTAVVVDSMASLTPRTRIMELLTTATQTGTTIVLINQMRKRIEGIHSPEDTTLGGYNLKVAMATRISLTRSGQIKTSRGDLVGSHIVAEVVKSRTTVPLSNAKFDIIYGKGICRTGCLLDLAIDKGLVTVQGSWYFLDGTQIGHGREATKTWLDTNPEIKKYLDSLIRITSK